MMAITNTASTLGIEGYAIRVEVDICQGLPVSIGQRSGSPTLAMTSGSVISTSKRQSMTIGRASQLFGSSSNWILA